MHFLAPAFVVVLWLWMDFVGLFLSVVSTSFYFGWTTPNKVPLIFLTALFCFSGPIVFGLLKKFLPASRILKLALALQFLLYVSATYLREPDVFPWLIVAGLWCSGLALTAALASLSQFKHWSTPWYCFILSVFFYLGVRLNTQGLAMLFVPPFSRGSSIAPWALLSVGTLAGLFLPAPSQEHEQQQPIRFWQKSYGLSLGLLLGPALGLIYNLHIWSALTPNVPAMVYLCSLVLGTLLAWGVLTRFPQGRWLAVLSALLGLGFALSTVLNAHPELLFALLTHTAGAYGSMVVFALAIYRLVELARRGYFPLVAFQAGFVIFLFVLAVFLLKSNPMGFWVALVLGGGVLIWGEAMSGTLEVTGLPQQRLWLFTFAGFFLPGALALTLPAYQKEAPNHTELSVMTSNIRYGWTDDYRFVPQLHVDYLKEQTADVMALQEVNKGHTSGAYMDLYQFYKTRLPGHWRFGDANFGFGNALRSQYPIVSSEVKTYEAKDILRRSCLINTIEFQGQKVDIYNTHLSHLPPPNAVRLNQVKELKTWLKQGQRPWILMGDFNSTPDSTEVQSLLEVASPIFGSKPELLSELTYSVLAPERRIDYVLFSDDFELVSQQVLDNKGTSDHQAVRSVLRLKSFSKQANTVPSGD